jgi:hypothetical protein
MANVSRLKGRFYTPPVAIIPDRLNPVDTASTRRVSFPPVSSHPGSLISTALLDSIAEHLPMIPNTDAQPTDSLYDRMLRRLVKLEEVVQLKIEQAPTAREKELEERVKHLERSLREMANRVRDVEDP